MGLILLAAIPAAIIYVLAVVAEVKRYGVLWENIWDGIKIASAISAFIALIIIVPIQLILGWIPETEWEVEEETSITALKDNTKTESGIFFLGTGTKDDRMVYYYMTEEDFGSRMDYLYSSNTHVKEVDNEGKNEPRIVKYKKVFKSDFAEFFFPVPTRFERTKTQIIVPKGTITDEFKIDME